MAFVLWGTGSVVGRDVCVGGVAGALKRHPVLHIASCITKMSCNEPEFHINITSQIEFDILPNFHKFPVFLHKRFIGNRRRSRTGEVLTKNSIAMLNNDHRIHLIPCERVLMMSIEHSAI